jgi:putative transposase
MRKARKLQEGGRYHVVARTNRKALDLDSTAMKDLFLATVVRAKKKYDFRVENFCIMGNHFHMVIQPLNSASLSAIMRWIMSVFAMAWNRIHHQTGHLWGGRFFSRLITNLAELLQVFRYIEDNPIKACLVERADDWRHGGLWHFRRGVRGKVDQLPKSLELLLPGYCTYLLT